MWDIGSHLLQPLTAILSKKVNFKWIDIEQKSFYDINCMVAYGSLLACPDLNKHFDIHTDTRHFHLGEVIIQKGKPIHL